MYPSLLRTAIALSSIVGLRMFGLFLVLPVLAVYGAELRHATPALIGLALGAYGATQALMQIPLGQLSDRIGRTPVIAGGLLVFLLGSVIAALSESIWGVVIGRALQGSGAIAAAVLALAADLSPEDRRQRVMASIGISVALSFVLAVVMGPMIAGRFGLAGLFWVTAGLAAIALLALFTLVPAVPRRTTAALPMPQARALRTALQHPDLLRLNLTVGALNVALTCFFLIIPARLINVHDLPLGAHWMVYLPVLLLTIPVLAIAIRGGERHGQQVVRAGILAPGVAVIVALTTLLTATQTLWILLPALWLFFSGFNLLEANLPAFTARYASTAIRGAALGVYATWQFGGAFLGGLVGGLLLGWQGEIAVLLLAIGLLVAAMVAGLRLRPPRAGGDDGSTKP